MGNFNSSHMDKDPIDFTDPNIRHDQVLIAEGVKFHVSSEFLSIHSKWFSEMFNSKDNEEFKKKEIEMEFYKSEELRSFLDVIYLNPFEITEKNYRSMVEIAYGFLAPGVMNLCRTFINNNFNKLDKFDLLECAFKHNLDNIKARVALFLLADKPGLDFACQKGFHNLHCTCYTFNSFHVIGFAVNKKSFLAKNYDRFMALPDDAKAFIFEKILAQSKKQ